MSDASISSAPSTSSGIGRPQLPFEQSSEHSIRRKIEKLRESATSLMNAAQTSLRKEGKYNAASIIQEAALTTPARATKIKKAWKSP